MSKIIHIFDPAKTNPYTGFEPIPQGDYLVMITESSLKDTKNGTGQYVELVMVIIEGEFKGHMLWDRLNIVNNNERAAQIAQQKLTSIGVAIGKRSFEDTDELHDKPFVAHVKLINIPQYGKKNEIALYKPLSTVATKPAVSATISNKTSSTLPPTPKTRSNKTAPWEAGKPKGKPEAKAEEPSYKDEITF